MDTTRPTTIPIMLKGMNFLLWSRMVKTALGGRGLAHHLVTDSAPTQVLEEGDGQEVALVSEDKWLQEDQHVLSILQSSLEGSILEAYSYCDSAKSLWDTLHKVYGNISNLSRVYEVKKAINNLAQEELEFTAHFGKFRSLWAELEMLRPNSTDPQTILDRREQDKVFGLLLTLNPRYNDLIKHILRSDKLPSLEEVCSQIQREQGSYDLFGGKNELVLANKGAYLKQEDKQLQFCPHCKRKGHTKETCWILHPHLKPSWLKGRPGQYNFSSRKQNGGNANGNALTPNQMAMASTSQGGQDELVKKSDLEAIIKAIKDNYGNTIGKTLSASYLASESHKPLIVDSGASHHMISNVELLSDLAPALGNVVIANGDRIPIKGIGKLKLFDKESKALYIPNFTSNLLSVQKVTHDLDCNVIFSSSDVKFQDIRTSKILGQGTTHNGLYTLKDLQSLAPISYALSSSDLLNNNTLWHARLGHPHSRALQLLLPDINFDNAQCEACILGKHCKTVFPNSRTTYESCFDLVHSDVWTAPCSSRDNQKYFVSFIDEKSKYTWITLMQSKDRVLEAFKNFHSYVINHFNAKIKFFRTDNGGEYTSNAFATYLNTHGILHQTSCPYTPQQNGVAERKNRHLMEVARCMMFYTKVPKRFWSDAVLAACYLINRIPTRILHDNSPFEVLNSTKPSLDHLRVFGCVCFVLTPDGQRDKLDAKSTRGIFIGYSTTQKGYKCFIPESRRVIISRDVRFMEDKAYFGDQKWEDLSALNRPSSDLAASLRLILDRIGGLSYSPPKPSAAPTPLVPPHTPSDAEGEHIHPTAPNSPDLVHEGENENNNNHSDTTATHENIVASEVPDQGNVNTNLESTNENVEVGVAESPQVLRRSTRIRGDPSNWINTRVYYNAQAVAHPEQAVCSFQSFPMEHQVFISKLDQNQVPRTYEEAMEFKVWRDAVKEEREAMERNVGLEKA